MTPNNEVYSVPSDTHFKYKNMFLITFEHCIMREVYVVCGTLARLWFSMCSMIKENIIPKGISALTYIEAETPGPVL